MHWHLHKHNKEQNGSKKAQNRVFLVVIFHENAFSKSKFRSKGGELFWPPNCIAYGHLYCDFVIFNTSI